MYVCKPVGKKKAYELIMEISNDISFGFFININLKQPSKNYHPSILTIQIYFPGLHFDFQFYSLEENRRRKR